MSIEIIVAAIGLFGIVVTAILAWWRERDKARRDRVAQVYAGYIDAVSQSAALQAYLRDRQMAGDAAAASAAAAQVQENRLAFMRAHSNILVYGSPRVIGSLNDFYEAQGAGADMARLNALLIRLITEMRADSNSADYANFGRHVDSIIGARADERAAAAMKAAQAAA